MTQVLDRFEEVADDYESFVQQIPKYDRIVETLVEVLDQLNRESNPETVVDVGVGTGNLAEVVIERFAPDAFHGVDGVEAMIEQARVRLDSISSTDVTFECTAFETWQPDGAYDWVYSNLSIHHLHDFEKRDLFDRIQRALTPEGTFLISDLVRIPGKRSEFYETIYRERLSSLGYGDAEIQNRWEQHEEHDIPSELRATLRWLREAGFGTVECVWKDFNRAIILASKRKRG